MCNLSVFAVTEIKNVLVFIPVVNWYFKDKHLSLYLSSIGIRKARDLEGDQRGEV